MATAPAKRKRDGPEGAANIHTFRVAIKDLETKSQSKIKNLTDLALQLYGEAANIVQAVVDEITGASPERIQPLLFVVDSILKKVGKDYKVHFADRLPTALSAACQKSNLEGRAWLKRMVEESWQKHELLPASAFHSLSAVFVTNAAAQFTPMMGVPPGGLPQGAPMMPPAPPPPPPAQSSAAASESDEQVERRLRILTKIIERKPPRPDELQEIMKVPEVRKAIAMQQKNQRQEATALLSQFKQELERRHREIVAEKDPRLRAEQAQQSRPADPRMDRKPTDPRGPVEGKDRPADPRARQEPGAVEKPPKKRVKAEVAEGEVTTVLSDEEVEIEDDEMPLAPARHFLQGMPSIGFSETWLRQFMSQMPRTKSREGTPSNARVGRKVLGASGEQLVYVDAISPGEMLLLMQFVFMLEEKLRSTGRSVDLAQRVSHTFSFLQVDLAVDVMLKWVFDGLPFQCETTGLRFSTREKLRRHNEGLKRRKEQRQMNAEARGWMDPIPDWVGNRDLVVGPALFRLGGPESKVPERSAAGALDNVNSGPSGEAEEAKWEVPCDERRAVCPVSGERFERTWSSTLNHWAFTDAIATELQGTKALKFPPGGPLGPHGLSETAVIFKKSCFSTSTPSRRLEALQECCDPSSAKAPVAAVTTQAVVANAAAAKEDADLAKLLQPAPVRKFF